MLWDDDDTQEDAPLDLQESDDEDDEDEHEFGPDEYGEYPLSAGSARNRWAEHFDAEWDEAGGREGSADFAFETTWETAESVEECGLDEDPGAGDWNPFDKDGKPPPPFPPRDAPPRDRRPDLTLVFQAEYQQLLLAMSAVRAEARSIFKVTQEWRRYEFNVSQWCLTPIWPAQNGYPKGLPSYFVAGFALWHFKDEVWDTPEGRHFSEVRDGFRRTDENCLERQKARQRKYVTKKLESMGAAERTRRAEDERKRYAKKSSDPEYKKQRAECERARRAALKRAKEAERRSAIDDFTREILEQV